MSASSTNSDGADNPRLVTLQANDGTQFVVDYEVIRRFIPLIHEMLNDLGDEETTEVIPVDECSGPILRMVLDWCEHHRDDEEPKLEEEFQEESRAMPDWDVALFSGGMDELSGITKAANYLEIHLLLERCSRYLANLVEGRSTEEMRNIFGIVADFGPGEEEKIRQENQWAVE
ncbi:hypothetical protein MGN70_000871 [Eutypa lata]|uniref:E3 ubiquitin ligase complex SCF subunit n=1 Tax=Eutypa lata (strain UCR-EL1) TaxID=1287681 RepID=M7SV55_EUTLA|nr:putative e3 ubiquitin ligase complex scf subunit sconc protein [Eutypa lata UCREL1]KAI1257827.1 hypothetical protein MGN70_000871 [Eutypa lata]